LLLEACAWPDTRPDTRRFYVHTVSVRCRLVSERGRELVFWRGKVVKPYLEECFSRVTDCAAMKAARITGDALNKWYTNLAIQ
jgi:hypothetical protein